MFLRAVKNVMFLDCKRNRSSEKYNIRKKTKKRKTPYSFQIEKNRVPLRVLNYRARGIRSVGRPKKSRSRSRYIGTDLIGIILEEEEDYFTVEKSVSSHCFLAFLF